MVYAVRQDGGEDMRTVKQMSEISGVSVRTLHHYDAIGLLKPSAVTEAGYRLYDDAALRRLHSVLLFRELQFPLKEIKKILDSGAFDPQQALQQQIELLELQKRHLEEVIAHAREIQKKGEIIMSFDVFDKKKQKEYEAEAKRRWGETEAYKEYERKAAGKDMDAAAKGLMEIFARFGAMRAGDPAAAEAQALVRELQDHISANYYTCTAPILAGLGQMYAAEGEMKDNIDAYGGTGTAEFAARAIAVFCR